MGDAALYPAGSSETSQELLQKEKIADSRYKDEMRDCRKHNDVLSGYDFHHNERWVWHLFCQLTLSWMKQCCRFSWNEKNWIQSCDFAWEFCEFARG